MAPTAEASDRTRLLIPLVLVCFAANSLITRHVVADDLLDPGLLTAVRFLAGAAALLALAVVRRERVVVGRANVLPALWLGIYAVCISYGYQHIGAAPGTFVFYAAVLLALVAVDVVRRRDVAPRRAAGALVSLGGLAVLAASSLDTVTTAGVLLLAVTGIAWGLYTAAGQSGGDPTRASTGHFALLGAVLLLPTIVGFTADLRVTDSGLGWAVLMGAGTTAFAYVAWYACQRTLSGTAAGSVQLVIPVLTALGAVLLLGEPFSGRLVVVAALVGAGMWLGRPPRSPRPHARAGGTWSR